MRIRQQHAIVAGTMLAGVLLAVPAAWAHKNLTNLAVTLSDNPAVEGTQVAVTGTLTYTGAQGPGSPTGHTVFPLSGDPVIGQTVQIQELQLLGVGVPCGTVGASFVAIGSGATDGLGQLSVDFDTTGLGGSTICFRAHHPAEGGSHGTNQAQSPGVDLVILDQPACVPGATIATSLASGDGTPPTGPGTWAFRVTVRACGDLTNVSAQGGTNGWAPTALDGSGLLPDTGTVAIRKANNKSQVILWTIGSMSDGQVANLDVTVNGTVPKSAPDCEVRYLSGPWSALFSLDQGVTIQKSAYSGRVSVSVDTNDDGNPSCP